MARETHHIGAAIRTARRAGRISQSALAKSADLDRATIRLIEAGRGKWSNLEKALDALGLDIRSRSLPTGPVLPALERLRARRKMSLRQVSRSTGMSRNTLAALCEGRDARVESVASYALALGVRLHVEAHGSVPSFFTEAGASTVHHGWETPHEIADRLHRAVGVFDLDPCSGTDDPREARIRAKLRLTAADDGLSAAWHGLVYVNPPYGRDTARWIDKCVEEAISPETRIVALLAVRTDTRWWARIVSSGAAICFLKRRLRFGDGRKDAPFASAIVSWNARDETISALRDALDGSWMFP